MLKLNLPLLTCAIFNLFFYIISIPFSEDVHMNQLMVTFLIKENIVLFNYAPLFKILYYL